MHRSIFLAFAALFALNAAAADDSHASFDGLDKNRDGKVSLNEASDNDALFVAFKNLDTNKDGELTREEFARYSAARTRA